MKNFLSRLLMHAESSLNEYQKQIDKISKTKYSGENDKYEQIKRFLSKKFNRK